MKRILIVTMLISLTTTVLARIIRWRPTDKPPLSIVNAVDTATEELNKDGADFYCLSASVIQDFSKCDWKLQFANNAGNVQTVSVGTDGKVRIGKDTIHK